MNIKEIQGAMPWFTDSHDAILSDISTILTSGELVKGRFLVKFQDMLAEMAGTEYALAVSSGGTALELALLALDVKGKEVIVPAQTFIASANAVTRAGGIPVFADIDKDTLCLDPADVLRKITADTAGVMFVHMFGLVPPSVLEIKKICGEKGLFLIEDAAHAHGSSIHGQKAGSIGDVGCFSFFATKVVTTGEGGAVTTNREDIFEKVKSLHDHGRASSGPLFEIPGNNFRLPEIACALGCHQLGSLSTILAHRNMIGRIYSEGLAGNDLISILPDWPGHHAYWRFPAYLSGKIDRSQFQKEMWDQHKIRITWMYEPLCHEQPVSTNGKTQQPLPVAEWAIKHLINLPTHMMVSADDAHRVVSCVLEQSMNMVK